MEEQPKETRQLLESPVENCITNNTSETKNFFGPAVVGDNNRVSLNFYSMEQYRPGKSCCKHLYLMFLNPAKFLVEDYCIIGYYCSFSRRIDDLCNGRLRRKDRCRNYTTVSE